MCTQAKFDFSQPEKLLVMTNSEERWRQLCAQAAKEQDPQKLMELVKEISCLLDEKEKQERPRIDRDSTQPQGGKPPTP